MFQYVSKFKSLSSEFSKYRKKVNMENASYKQHKTKSNIECIKNVVYSLPLTCGKVYIGETGNCFGERLDQHMHGLRKEISISKLPVGSVLESVYSNICSHTRSCEGCTVVVNECKIIKEGLFNGTARKLVEGYHIRQQENNISKLILDPTCKEIEFMQSSGLI